MQIEIFSKILSSLASLAMMLSSVTGILPSSNVATVSSSSTGVQVVVNDVGLQGINYNGQNYWFAGSGASTGGTLVANAFFRTPSGETKPYGWAENTLQHNLSVGSAVRSALTNPLGFQHIYRNGLDDSFTIKITYTPVGDRTLQIDTYVTNNDSTNTLQEINLYSGFLPIQTPGPTNQYNQNIPLSIGPMNQWFGSPVAFLSGDWGSLAYWMEDYSTNWNTFTYFGNSSQTQFGFYLQNSSFNTRQRYHDPIPPKQTKKFTTFLRFGSSSDTANSLAPEAFTSLRNSYPQLSSWSKRTPIARWFIAEGTKRSETNPRGYLWDPNLNVSDQANFKNRVLSLADEIINRMNAMNPKPQGILIWDFEGQEFNHAFTYVGYPNKIPDIAPEMDKVADELLAKFRNAGYEVGMTLRPQKFGTGYTLPSTCESRTGGSTRDVFIKIDGPFLGRNYVCVSPNTWQVTSLSPGHQTDVNDDNEIYELLKSKISYAKNRWGAKMFYVDSTVYTSGEPINFKIFRKLQQDFPDVVLFAENWNSMYWSSVSTYMHGSFGYRDVPTAVKNTYPNAFSVFQVIDGVNLTDSTTNNVLVESVKRGNILFVDGWYSPPSNETILKIYRDAGITNTGTPPTQPSDTTPPSTPTGLSAQAVSTSQINLGWAQSTDNVSVSGYRVERCSGSSCTNFSQIATPTETSYSDSGLAQGTSYQYRVRAVDSSNNLSSYSNTASATTLNPEMATYTISASAGLGGSISPSGSVSVQAGGSQTFNVVANSGYQIASVVVNGVGQGAVSTYTFNNVTSNQTISASFVASDTPPPPTQTNKFEIGNRVVTSDNLNVRTKAGSGKPLGVQYAGSKGTVLGGPEVSGGYTWWRIAYDNGVTGWSAENWLEKEGTVIKTGYKFVIGDSVITIDNLNVRANAGGGRPLGAQSVGSKGKVIGGPQVSGGYTWWRIDYELAPDGWSAENWLQKITQ